MTRAVDAENALQPCDDLVGGWVRRLVEIDDTGGDVLLEVTAERGAAGGDGCEVAGAYEDWA